MDFHKSHMEEHPAWRSCSVRSTLGNEEIRLLELSPAANRTDVIECTLRTVLLAEAPDYEAVSYVWGDQTLVGVVRVDGVEEKITSNLHDLLINLRYHELVRTIWVDALCINQGDEHERSEQVKLMGRIYREAARVVVFLGQEWDGVDIACEYLELAARRTDAHLYPSMDPHLEVRGQNITTPCLRDNLTRFFSSEWFFRVWTVQEFVLAKKTSFLYGTTLLSGHYLQKGLTTIRQHGSSPCCGPDALLGCGELLVDVITHMDALNEMKDPPRGCPRNFLAALHHCRRRQCTDPRDRIYGMLGMDFKGQRGLSSLLPPDYTIPVESLFVKLAGVQIRMTKTLDVLSYALSERPAGKSRSSLRLPSWVPDWTLRPENRLTHLLSVDQHLALLHYNASGGRLPNFHIQDNGRAISQGIVIDRIEAVGMECSFSTTEDWSVAMDAICEARRLVGLPTAPPKSFEAASPTEIARWRALCGSLAVHFGGIGGDLRKYGVSDFKEYFRRISSLKEKAFRDALAPNLSARRFMRTENGYLGLVAAGSLPGDLVVLLAGGRKPFILREKAVDDTAGHKVCYSLMGDGYVDGFMQGEVLESGAQWTHFLLV